MVHAARRRGKASLSAADDHRSSSRNSSISSSTSRSPNKLRRKQSATNHSTRSTHSANSTDTHHTATTSHTTTALSRVTESCDETAEGMWFKSLFPLAPVTVVLLHVLFSSHLEWAHVWTEMTEYHLLIPDLPQHSRSRALKPFSYALAADHVANMIRNHANDGQAHIVGLTTGGWIALELIRRHPDVVTSAFVASADLLPESWRSSMLYPKLVHYGLATFLCIPANFVMKASGWSPELQNDELLREIKRNNTSSLAKAGTHDCMRSDLSDVAEAGRIGNKRIALVVSGKHGALESGLQMLQILQERGTSEGGGRSRAFVVRDAVHAWNLQFPELFAKGVKSWIEGGVYMPTEFEPLD